MLCSIGKILVIYDSGYGATADAAKTIAGTLTSQGLNVDLNPVGLRDPVGYDAVLVGSPIQFSQCTSVIKRFLKKYHTVLAGMHVAFFFTCMSVTMDESQIELPLYIDPCFLDPNKPRARIKLMENNHTASYYLKRILKAAPGISPLGISFFKGRLNMSDGFIALPGGIGTIEEAFEIFTWAQLGYHGNPFPRQVFR